MAMKRILHEIRLDRIAAVDRPCQQPAVATIMKRAPAPPVPGLESIQAPDGADWPKRRGDALEGLKRGAEALAKSIEGLSPAAAYDRFLATPEGAELYRQSL